MKSRVKIDPALVIGLGIPVVMIAIIAAAITGFRSDAEIEDPRYDFLHGVGYFS